MSDFEFVEQSNENMQSIATPTNATATPTNATTTPTNATATPTNEQLNTTMDEKTNSPMLIGIDCVGFTINLHNNIVNFIIESADALKLLDGRITNNQIDRKEKRIILTTRFQPADSALFNQLVDHSIYDIEKLIDIIQQAMQYFNNYDISRKMQNFINRYVWGVSTNADVWHRLVSKPDYNLNLFKTRTLPYFHIESKEWVKANNDALLSNYPSELIRAASKRDGTTTLNSDQVEFSDEINMATRNNNFLEWNLLPVEQYPDLDKLMKIIQTIHDIGLKNFAVILFTKFLIAPNTSHIIFEPKMWAIFEPIMASNKDIEEIIRYACCYAMYILRQEETIMFTQVNLKYRVLVTLEQAASLPSFSSAHMERDPYITQLTDDSRLSDSIPFYTRGYRKINSRAEFNRRFNIATGGAFKNVDLRKLGAAITGSILIPCVHKNPLEAGFEDVDWCLTRGTIKTPFPYMVDTLETAADKEFWAYLETYYPSYVSLTNADYQSQVLKKEEYRTPDEDIHYEKDTEVPATVFSPASNEIKTSDSTHDNQRNTPHTNQRNAEPVSRPAPTSNQSHSAINPNETERKPIQPTVDYNQLADIDISITCRDFETFTTNALSLYEQIKDNCSHRGPVYIKEVRTLNAVKYKIYGPGIPRPMDIFRIPYEPVKMVKKFHVHAVKMYYDNDITMFRSCVACLLSGVGESYKWFSCNKVPADVLLKYAQRGISIILNKIERDALSNYIEQSDRWGVMLRYFQLDAKKIYCCVTSNHPFFRPDIHGSGVRLGLREFKRDLTTQYNNSLVVSIPRSNFTFGDLPIKDNNTFHEPNYITIMNYLMQVAL